MVSAKAAKRKTTADPSNIDTSAQEKVVSQQQVEGQRNMKGETSGRQGGPAAGSAVAKQGKVSKAAKKCSEVDQLFDQLKKSTSTTDSKVEQQQDSLGKATTQKQKKKKPVVAGSKDDIFAQGRGKKRRVDPDGLAVYTEDELKVGQGGSTPQCPFDCDCCF